MLVRAFVIGVLCRWHVYQKLWKRSLFFSSISKVSDQFVLIIGLPLKIHLKKNMTLALRKKAGLDKQMLQTIKDCQNAHLHKAHLVISL